MKGWKGRRKSETTSSLEKRKRKTDTLSFELEAKVLLEPDRNSRQASAKGPKKTASSRKRKRTKGDGVTRLCNTFHVTSSKSSLYVLQFTFCDSNYADIQKRMNVKIELMDILVSVYNRFLNFYILQKLQMRQLYEDDKEYLYLTFNINIFNKNFLYFKYSYNNIQETVCKKIYIYKIYKKETIF